MISKQNLMLINSTQLVDRTKGLIDNNHIIYKYIYMCIETHENAYL